LKVHDAVTLAASRAWHDTNDVPSGNVLPELGVQVVVTGAVPPLDCGALKVTARGVPSDDAEDTFPGHVSESAGAGDGPFGESPQAWTRKTAVKSASALVNRRPIKLRTPPPNVRTPSG
jgi:hypothetical protein